MPSKSSILIGMLVSALMFCCTQLVAGQDEAMDGGDVAAPGAGGDEAAAAGAGAEAGGSMTESQEESQREKETGDRIAAQQLQEEIEKAHANDPKDPLQLAARTLDRAFERHQGGKKEVAVFQLMGTVSRAAGEPRLLLLRIFELMDADMNGMISNEEFTSLYMAPVAYPDRALELMFKLHDLDRNGFITQWEYLRFSLTVGGINQNLQDKWIEAEQKLKQQDVNGDGLVDLTEFTLFVVWQVNVGIHNQKQREQAASR